MSVSKDISVDEEMKLDAGPGTDPEECGTCRYMEERPTNMPICCVDNFRSPEVWLVRPGCQRYVHRDIREDR